MNTEDGWHSIMLKWQRELGKEASVGGGRLELDPFGARISTLCACHDQMRWPWPVGADRGLMYSGMDQYSLRTHDQTQWPRPLGGGRGPAQSGHGI